MFRAVMSTGSFTKAAELLHVAQPGISRLVRHLELQLGVTLFERAHSKIAATPEARALYEEVERAYRGVQAVHDFAKGLRAGISATFRVLTSPNAALELMPQVVAELSGKYPRARLSLEIQQRATQMTDLLVTEQAEVGISALELEHPLLENRPIGNWALACVMPMKHSLAKLDVVTVADLASHRIVAFHRDTLQGRTLEALLKKRKTKPSVSVEVRSGDVACALVANGAGIAIVDSLTARAFRSHGLVSVPMRNSPRFTMYAVLNRNRPPPMLARKLCDLVSIRLAQHAQD